MKNLIRRRTYCPPFLHPAYRPNNIQKKTISFVSIPTHPTPREISVLLDCVLPQPVFNYQKAIHTTPSVLCVIYFPVHAQFVFLVPKKVKQILIPADVGSISF